MSGGEPEGGGWEEEEVGAELGLEDKICSSKVWARISKLLFVAGREALSCWGFFPVEGFLCAHLQLGALVKPFWVKESEGSGALALAFGGQSLSKCP